MKELIQKLSDSGWSKLNDNEKDVLRKNYNKSDLQEISDKRWENTSESTKSRVRDIFNYDPNKSIVEKIKDTQKDWIKAYFPRLSQSSGENFGSDVVKGSMDAMSLPGRFGASIIGSGRQIASGELPTPLVNLGLTESDRNEEVAPNYIRNKIPEQYYNTTKGISNFVEDIQRSPFTVIPTVGKLGGELLSMAPKAGQILLEKTPAIVQGLGRVGAEAASVPAIMSLNRYSKGEETTPTNIENEIIAGGLLGAIPGIRQYATSLQDKRTGLKIAEELLQGGTRASKPMVTGNLDADKKMREGLRSMYSDLFDNTKSTNENVQNILEYARRSHPDDQIRRTIPALEDIYQTISKEVPKKPFDLIDVGIGSVAGTGGIPAIAARKVAGNTQFFYDRVPATTIDPFSLGRSLYVSKADATSSQQNRERR